MTNFFESMSDQELKQYFLKHRDEESFHAYMDRRSLRPKRILIEAGELDHLPFDEQIKIVDERMRSRLKISDKQK